MCRFPFDTKNPIGYLIAVTFEYMQITYEFFLLANLLSLAIGSFSYAMSINKDIKCVLFSMNAYATNKENQFQTTLIKFAEFVEEQSATKR